MKRRAFIKSTLAGSVATFAGTKLGFGATAPLYSAPNILVILVDEMRALNWIPKSILPQLMPNLSKLLAKSANFDSYYTAATACSSARGSLVTGLYSHQSSVITNFPGLETLPPEMPTYGTGLRSLGYDTFWYGKWHLASVLNTNMDQYGFNGGTFPDPDGLPDQGKTSDPKIAAQFKTWLALRSQSNTTKKWCTTVSFVNPHDVTGFWRFSDILPDYQGPYALPPGFLDSNYFAQLGGKPCANFEDPNTFGLSKPSGQLLCAQTIAQVQGGIAFSPGAVDDRKTKPYSYWQKLLQFYAYLHNQVDVEIGKVIDALNSSKFGKNTVVLFTADHGEYGGAHGLMGKNLSAYEEAIRIPFAVYDPTGKVVKSPLTRRNQLFSHVDLMPLLLTIGAGGNTSAWKSGGKYSYLAARANIHAALQNPLAAGRSYVLFTTDEWLPGVDFQNYHIATMITREAKFSAYGSWFSGSSDRSTAGEELELYDYRGGDRSELHNVAASSDLTDIYYQTLLGASGNGGLLASEIRAPLPPVMESARIQNLQKYFKAVAR